METMQRDINKGQLSAEAKDWVSHYYQFNDLQSLEHDPKSTVQAP